MVTGTELLSGQVSDRNGPWLSERLAEHSVEVAYLMTVGDRPADILAALRFMAAEGMDLVVTSGGLGPTADDLTAEVVGAFCAREMVLDEGLEERIAAILRPLLARWPRLDPDAVGVTNRKQAVIPRGATVLEPVGTAPGLVVGPSLAGAGPTVVVLPGPSRELQPMWGVAVTTEAFTAAIGGAEPFERRMVRLFGVPESEIAETLRLAEDRGIALDRLEITTCLRRGELEVGTRYASADEAAYERLVAFLLERHGDELVSLDGETIDALLARLLAGRSIAVGESCTGGLLAARLTELAGASGYVAGGVVAYSNAAKTALLGVDPEVIERAGAVSPEVAEALARGALERFGADVGVGVTGVAGPGGGSAEKPVGRVCLCAVERGGAQLERTLDLPGDRLTVRDRATTFALHLVRRLLSSA